MVIIFNPKKNLCFYVVKIIKQILHYVKTNIFKSMKRLYHKDTFHIKYIHILYLCKMVFDDSLIFIVGNSRSGTTLLMRVLEHHQNVFVFNELHFFEELWSPDDKNKKLSVSEAVELYSKLLLTQRIGYKTHDQNYHQFDAESEEVIKLLPQDKLTGEFVFTEMLKREAALHHKTIICEKTPQNVFYLKEILEIYPNARIINMVRDPRAIMLSQKNKWNRRKLGSDYMTEKEALRLRINYHPITISKLWNAAITAARKMETDSRIITVRFEDLLDQPETIIRKVCKHLGIAYHENMLQIKQVSSSNEADSKDIGFKKERASNWKKGGLNKAEICWNEKICGDNMLHYGYTLDKPDTGVFQIAAYFISFPFKLILALFFNLDRMKNIAETLKRRLK